MPEDEENNPEEVKIFYKHDPQYRMFHATNVWGTVNPKGNLIMNFFTDVHQMPVSETRKIKNNQLDPDAEPDLIFQKDNANLEISDNQKVLFDRIIQNTAVLDVNDALEIAFWMVDTILADPSSRYNIEKIRKHFNNMLDKYIDEEI